MSHRSVFRYFEDLDELCRVAIERQYAAIAELLHIHEIGQGSLEKRIAAIVTSRLDLYELVAPVARVGHMRAPVEPVLLDHLRDNAAGTRDQVDRHFAPELHEMEADRHTVVAEAAAAAISVEMMEMLRFIRGLSRGATDAVMQATLLALFGSGND